MTEASPDYVKGEIIQPSLKDIIAKSNSTSLSQLLLNIFHYKIKFQRSFGGKFISIPTVRHDTGARDAKCRCVQLDREHVFI